MPQLTRRLYAFRLSAAHADRQDSVWLYVERAGGHMEIRSDCIDFFVPASAVTFLVLAYPELDRRADLDYC